MGLFATVLFLLGGCKTSFLGSPVKDFSAFFNRYYNASADFEKVERNMDKAPLSINREEYLPLFQNTSSDRTTLEKVVKRSADLVRFHPQSRWTDDAVMLIAKSYFYQEAYIGAEQKFKEIIAGGGNLEDEAQFWLVRTLIAAQYFTVAQDVINQNLEKERLSRRWKGMMRLAAVELNLRQGNWEVAAENLKEGLSNINDKNLQIRGYFLLGQVQETLGKHEDAIQSFRMVRRFKPAFPYVYAALMSEIDNRRKSGQLNEAVRLVNGMLRDDKYYDVRAEVGLQQAILLANMNQGDEAFLKLDKLLYDPKENAGQYRGRIHYFLGDLYTNRYRNFTKAAAHYDTAATSLRTGFFDTRSQAKTAYAITDASEKATAFKNFAATFRKIFEADSLLALGALDEEAFQEAVAQITEIKTKEAIALKAKNDQVITQNRFLGIETDGTNPSSFNQQNGQQFQTGFLNHQNTAMVQEALNNFKQRWGNRPLAPNWRRIEALRSVVNVDTTKTNTVANNPNISATELGVKIDVERVPRTPEKRATMAQERDAWMYDLGNTLFLSMAMPDSAIVWYRKVIDRSPESEVAQRAYFALAEIQLAKRDTLSAHRIYRQIIEDSHETDFADRARERLGMGSSSIERDSTQLAQRAYDKAYVLWQEGSHASALEAFFQVATQFRQTPTAQQALFAAGETALSLYKDKGMDWFEELPIQPDSTLSNGKAWTIEDIYQHLKTKHAQSPYGKAAIERLNALKELKSPTSQEQTDSSATTTNPPNQAPLVAQPPVAPEQSPPDTVRPPRDDE